MADIISKELSIARHYAEFKAKLIGAISYWIKGKIGKKCIKEPEKFFGDLFIGWFFINNTKPKEDAMLLDENFVVSGDINYFFTVNRAVPSQWPAEREKPLRDEYNKKIRDTLASAGQNMPMIELKLEKGRYQLNIGRTRRGDSLSEFQYQRLLKLYSGDPKNFIYSLARLIVRYQTIGKSAVHLSLPPTFFDIEELGFRPFELFGTPFNTVSDYCSPFEFEKEFESHGNFFEYQLKPDVPDQMPTLYICNPPLSEVVLEFAAARVVEQMAATPGKLQVCFVLPVWDPQSQREMEPNKAGKYAEIEFHALKILQESEFICGHCKLPKAEFPYYDSGFDRLVPGIHSHLIILANYPMANPELLLARLVQKWRHPKKNKEIEGGL